MRREVHVVDSHTGGEPTRVVIAAKDREAFGHGTAAQIGTASHHDASGLAASVRIYHVYFASHDCLQYVA